jgi:hypothetical protein
MLIGAESARLATAITIGHLNPDAKYRTSCIRARPWLEVAVKARPPARLAPTQADIAECSDSTFTNFAFVSPSATRSLKRSTIIVCGVIGYAEIKSMFDCIAAFATASEPLIGTNCVFIILNEFIAPLSL